MAALDVVAHRDLAGAAGLDDAWADLHAESGSTNPFAGPAWSSAWWTHLRSAADTPLLLEVRARDRLVGVASFRRQRLPGGIVRLAPVGSGPPWLGFVEGPTMLTAPDHARDVGRAVVTHLCAAERGWDWAELALDDRTGWLEPEWLPHPDFGSTLRKVTASVVLDLRPPEAALLTGRRNLKESLRRARNRLDRDFGADGWSVQVTRRGAELPAAIGRLADLHGRRSRSAVGSRRHADLLAGSRERAYLLDAVRRLASRDHVSVHELVAGGEVLAGQLVLQTATAAYCSLSGLDERAWEYSAVTQLQWSAALAAKAAGRTSFDLSINPNQAKRRWSEHLAYHPEFAVVAPRRRSRAAYTVAAMAFTGASFLRTGRMAVTGAAGPAAHPDRARPAPTAAGTPA